MEVRDRGEAEGEGDGGGEGVKSHVRRFEEEHSERIRKGDG